MICNRCGCPIYDGANFCPNCGVQFNPHILRPYQPPPPHLRENEISNNAQNAIFILGLASFALNMLLLFATFFQQSFLFDSLFRKSGLIFKSITFIVSITIVFLCFIFAKKQTHKIILLVFFVLLAFLEISQIFLRNFFRHLF
jgi:hypothetical protein